MKKLSFFLVVVLLLGIGAVVAQETTVETQQQQMIRRGQGRGGQQGRRDGSGMKAAGVRAAQTADTAVQATEEKPATGVIKSTTCDGTGRGYGDGTRLKPRDGTGFGATKGARRHRNAKAGQGKKAGPQDGSAPRQKRQLKDGSGNGACQEDAK